MEDKKKALYDALSGEFDLGSFESFSSNIEDDTNRRNLYDAIKDSYDVGDYDSFSSKLTSKPINPVNAVIEQASGIPYPGKETDKSQYTFTGEQLGLENPVESPEGDEHRYTGIGKDYKIEPVYEPQFKKEGILGQSTEEYMTDVQKNLDARKKDYNQLRQEQGIRAGRQDVIKDGDRYYTPGGSYDNYLKAGHEVDMAKEYNGVPMREIAEYYSLDENKRAGYAKSVGRTPEEIEKAYESKEKGDINNQMSDLYRRIDAGIRGVNQKKSALQSQYEKERGFGGFIKDALMGSAEAELPVLQGQLPGSALEGSREWQNLDKQEKVLWASARQFNTAQKMINAAKSGDFVTGMGDALQDLVLGGSAQDMQDLAAIKEVSRKFEKGEELTAKEEMLLESIAMNVAVASQYQEELSAWYNAGKMTGEMIPYMVEMWMNPLSKLGNKFGQKVLDRAKEKYGKDLAKHLVSTKIKTGLAKLGGAALGGYGMSLTTGLPSVITGVQKRTLGDAVIDKEMSGDVKYAGRKDADGLGTAIYKETTQKMLDNASEMLGAGYLGKPFSWLQKAGKGTKLLGWIDNIANSKFGKSLNDFMEKTNWHGPLEEFMEEIHVGILEPVLVGDTSWGKFFTGKNLATIAIGVSVPGVAMATAATLQGAKDGAFKAGAKEKWKMERGELRGIEAWGPKWEEVKQKLDSNSLDDVDKVLTEIHNDKTLTPEQKVSAFEYGIYGLQYRTTRGVVDAFDSRKDMLSEMLRDTYSQAYSTEPTGEATIQAINNYQEVAKRVMDTFQLSEEQEIDDMLAEESIETLANGDSQVADMLYDYKMRKAYFEGAQDRFLDTLEEQFAQSDKSIDSRANKDNPTAVYSTVYNGEQVNITGGNVVLFENGKVDYDNSSETLYVTFPDNTVKPVSAKNFTEVVTVENAEELKAAGRAEIDNRWRSEFDNAEKIILDGKKRKEGKLFNTSDELGEHTVEVLEEGETESRILLDGKEYPISTEELNQWRNEAGVVPEAEAPAVAPVVNEVAPIPTEKRGNVERAAYHLVPIERTMEDLHDGQLDQSEVQELINARIKEAYNDVQALEKKKPKEPKKPKMEGSKEAYLAAKVQAKEEFDKAQTQWQASMDEAKQRLDYYNELYAREQEITKSEIKEAYDNVQPREVIEITADEFIANNLPKITPESFKAETGLSNSEQAEMVGYIAGADKGGVTVEQAAENIMENYGDELRSLGYSGDMQDVRDTIINILSQGNPRSYAKQGLAQRKQESIDQQRAEMETVAVSLGFKSVEDMSAYEEQVIPGIIQMYTGFDYNEYYNNLAENYEYDTTRESETTGRGSELLQGEQLIDNAGTPVAEGNEGGAVPSGVQGNGTNAQTSGNEQVNEPVGNSEQLSSSEIPNNQSVAEAEDVSPVEESNPLAKHAENIAKRLGVNVTLHTDASTVADRDAMTAIAEGGVIKGWYNPNTGEIALYMPNMESVRDVESTILHEAVSHYGIKNLLGKEEFNKFLDAVWEMMPASERAFYLEYVGADMKNPSQRNMRAAADEYVAHIAEKMDLSEVEKSIWDRILDFILARLKEVGFANLDRGDIENVIKASYRNLARNGGSSQVTGQGETMASKKLPKAEYEVLRQTVMVKNSLYGKNRPIETAFTAENFYIYNNYGDDSFAVIKAIPIEGNEFVIEIINGLVEDGKYRNGKELSEIATVLRRKQKQRNRGERIIKGQRGENGRPVSLDLRQSSERGGDNAQGNSNERGEVNPQDSESGIRFRKVTDPAKIAELEAGEKMKTYRAMALIDGKLYPPMSSKNDGVLREPSEIGVWEEAEENLGKAKEKNGKYYFTLTKDNGKSVRDVAYNPYLHSSTTMLNDQFKEAQSRDNLVVVEMEIPTSELTSGYKADKAHDAVGTKDWKAGTIQGQLTGTREVVLSRWGKPVRIVPVEEVAENIKAIIDGEVEYMPTNVVTPQQRKALEDLGVKFVETNNSEIIQEGEHKGEQYSAVYGKKAKKKTKADKTMFRKVTPEMDAEYMAAVENGDMETAERLVKEAAKLAMPDTKVVDKDGYPMPMFHGDRKKGRYKFSTDTFFTPNEQYAKRYTGGTGEVYPVYLNIEKPFDVRDNEAREIFTEFNGGNAPVETTTGALDWGQYTYEDLQEYIEENYPGEYDGFILDEGGEPDYNGNVVHRGLSYIPFTSSQAKYSSAVTYDDNGNVIPLSERFDEEKEDIRFRKVFHGSGAKFDRFDHAFMGTGEGAQAFGWGTYVTEVEGIGKQYATTMRDKAISEKHRENAIINNLARQVLASNNGDKNAALEELRNLLNESWSDKKRVKAQIKIIETGKFLPETKLKAHLYNVEIPDDNGSNYLHWEEVVPKKVETAVKERLLERLSEGQGEAYKSDLKQELDVVFRYSDFNGRSLYQNISAYLGGDKQASLFLGDMGFVGISYPANATTGGRADGARNYVIFNENDAEIKDRTMFRISKTPQEFDATQAEAVEKRGIVTPWLNEAVVNVVSVPRHDFTGNLKEARSQAREWAIENYTGKEFDLPENAGKYVISKNAIGKYLDKSAFDKSDNAAVHLSVLKELPNVISNSIEVEIHADYSKGDNGERSAENGVNRNDLLVHRIYGAVNIDGKTYRVKTTIHEFRDGNTANTPHSYEVTKIELIEDSTVTPNDGIDNPLNRSVNSISATKLLEGVEKSYDKGKKVLQESVMEGQTMFRRGDIPEVEQQRAKQAMLELIQPFAKEKREEEIRFKKAYHGSGADFERFDHSFMNSGEGAQAFGYGTYVTAHEATAYRYGLRGKVRTKKGNLYEVEIPESGYIQWDEDVNADELRSLYEALPREKVEAVLPEEFKGMDSYDGISAWSESVFPGESTTGEKVYRAIGYILGSEKAASEFLNKQGYTGIAYEADGAKNYVIFNEDDAQITEHTRFSKNMRDVERVINEFNRIHKGALPVRIVQNFDNWKDEFREFGVKEDEISRFEERIKEGSGRPKGAYLPDADIIVIFDHSLKGRDLEGALWHENMHKAIRRDNRFNMDVAENVVKTYLPNDYKEFIDFLENIGYHGLNAYEEALCQIVQSLHLNGGLSRKGIKGTGVVQEYLNPLIVKIYGYGKEYGTTFREIEGDLQGINEGEIQGGLPENSIGGGVQTAAGAEETRFSREVEEAKSTLNVLAEKLNAPINAVEDVSTLPEKERSKKGWMDKEGNVSVVLDNHISIEDVAETVLHEVVGKRGLHSVMGESFDEMLDDVYENATPQTKRAVNNIFLKSLRNGFGMTIRECTAEYLAELAERGFDGYNNLWNTVKQVVRDSFYELIGIEVSDNEIRYLLWKNRNRLKNGPVETILDRAMEARTDTGNGSTMFRRVSTGGVGERYDRRVEGVWNKFKEGWYDATRSMRVAQEEIEMETGKAISDSANLYDYANHLPSINRNKMERFDIDYIQPFLKFLKGVRDIALQSGEKLNEQTLGRYANAKHGIERNREMSVRKALTEVQDGKKVFNDTAYREWQEKKKAILANGESWMEQQDKLDALARTYGAKIRDYSGLTAIFDAEKKKKYADVRKTAVDLVLEVEGKIDSKAFWEHVNNINGYSLKENYESGLMSKKDYDNISSMYEYYVPLRGHKDTMAEDVYEYVEEKKSNLNGVVKTAHGRTSEAKDIFATMLNMANSAIVFGSKNRFKQRLLNLALMNRTPLLSVGEAWYIKAGEEYIPAYPNIDEKMTSEEIAAEYERFEQEMKNLETQGLAEKHRQGLNLKYAPEENWAKNQHAVSVKRNGKEYIVYVNGSPKLAQAVNGLLLENDSNWFLNSIDRVNQWRAKTVTGYSPSFVVRNLVRDFQSASVAYNARHGAAAMWEFDKNVSKLTPQMHYLYNLYKKNELDESNKTHRYFKEFLENGGETGYTEMISIEEYQKKIKKYAHGASLGDYSKAPIKAVAEVVEFANRGVENICRFAAYKTSREAGMSILKSVNDAKEVSVNFNRKGSGAYGQATAKRLYMFLNPAIQAMVQRIEFLKKFPKRIAAVYATEFAIGAAMPTLFTLLYSLLGGDDDEAMGNYYNLTNFKRRSNICLPLGDGVVCIPLAHESRVVFGLGEMFTSYIMGHTEYDNVGVDIFNTLTQSLPINPVEGVNPGDNIAETIKLNLSPDAIKPFVEIGVNKDFAGNTIHNASDFNKHYPEHERGKRGAGTLFALLSETLSGEYSRNGIDDALGEVITPSSLEHLTKGYLGGLYTFADEAVKTAQWMAGDEEFAEFKNIPIANGFYTSLEKYESKPTEERTRRDWEKAYKFYAGEIALDDGTEKNYKRHIKEGDSVAESEYNSMIERGESLRIDIFNDGREIISALYDEINTARDAKDFKKVEELDKQIYTQKRFVVERMEQLREDPMSGYTMLRMKTDDAYGERETYGDVRDVNVINDFQKTIKPVDGVFKSEKAKGLYKKLDRMESVISKMKKRMEKPENAERYMTKIRETRAQAIELINNYRNE